MQIISDLQIHSPYSRATSKNISIESLTKGSRLKGLNLVGTGDFTHPKWFEHLKERLKEKDNSGIYEFDDFNFLLTSEVSTIYVEDNKTRKVHHLIFAPNFEIVEQISEVLGRKTNLSSDGRPIINVSSAEIVEMMMRISPKILIIPAHVWTSWFGALGEYSGYNSIEECYKDQARHIHAIETGLSSNPEMNRRISLLDRFSIVSFSDAHSTNPWRLGREFTVFDLKKFTYDEILDAIRKKEIAYTGEVPVEYGKYHLDGHRRCGISLTPQESKKFNNICPKCGRKLTIGVLHRVEELADRKEGVAKNTQFKTLLPLYEIISFALGVNVLYSKKVLEIHDRLIEKFGSELNVLTNVEKDELLKSCEEKVADAIIRVREGKVNYVAGFDGVYGRPVFNNEIPKKTLVEQKSLRHFKGP